MKKFIVIFGIPEPKNEQDHQWKARLMKAIKNTVCTLFEVPQFHKVGAIRSFHFLQDVAVVDYFRKTGNGLGMFDIREGLRSFMDIFIACHEIKDVWERKELLDKVNPDGKNIIMMFLSKKGAQELQICMLKDEDIPHETQIPYLHCIKAVEESEEHQDEP